MSVRDDDPAGHAEPAPPRARSRPRKQASPATGDAPAEAWLALYAAARRYRDAAPWSWLSDGEIVGVRDPLTGETAWCAALGAAGEIFGLLAHRGAEGFHVHERMQAGTLDPDEALFAQKALLIDFTDRADLDRRELSRLRALGLSFRGPQAWPRVESHEPGFVPALPDLRGVQLLTCALEQSLDVFLRAAPDPSLLVPDAMGRLLVRAAAEAGDAGARGAADAGTPTWSDTRESPPPPPPPDPPPRVDDMLLQRLRNEWRSTPATLEFAAFHTLATIAEPGQRPYFAIAALLVESASGAIVDVQVEAPPLTPQRLSDAVLAALGKLGSRPARLHVKTESTRAALQPLASGLGIELRRARSTPALDEAAAALKAAMIRS